MTNTLPEKNSCCGCSVCSNACPQNAITMKYDDEGFLYPNVLENKCIDCGLCAKICPNNHTSDLNNPFLKVYGGYSLDSAVMENCTSGGFVTELSKHVIRSGGVVAGVRYTSDYIKAEYDIATTPEELKAFMGSKYVQSEKNDIYIRVKAQLEASQKPVLFVGCPCDVYGLKRFLNKNYQNLVTCELVCMGVTSYKIAEDYKKYTQKKNGSELVYINARSKKKGWYVPHLEEVFENGKTKLSTLFGTIYGYGFQVYNRPSCFTCGYRGENGVGDFRVGDFWGIKPTDEFWNPKGVSCVFVRTKKGLEYAEELSKHNFAIFETTYDYATKNNMSSRINKSEKYLLRRKKFAEIYKSQGLIKACKKTEDFNFKIKKIMPNFMKVWAKKTYHYFKDKS